MITSSLILEVLNECAAESSRTGKEKILSDNWHEVLGRVAHYAYNPFMRFHVSRKAAEALEHDNLDNEDAVSSEEIFEVLDDLTSRAITGNAALGMLEDKFSMWDEETKEVFLRILAKDLRCGVSEKTFNKVAKSNGVKGLIPEFDVQLASKYEPKRWSQPKGMLHSRSKLQYPALVEPKLDGMRVVIFVGANGEVEIKSRGGRDIDSLDFTKDQFSRIVERCYGKMGVMYDAEVISGSFNDTVSLIKKKDQDAIAAEIYIFDMLLFDVDADTGVSDILREIEQDAPKDTLARRLDLLNKTKLALRESVEEFPNIKILEDYTMANNEDEALEAYADFKLKGYEGAIVKDLKAPYEFKRSKGWQKVKPSETHDLTVVGVQEGTGKYVGHLGALIVDMGGVSVHVGTGFSDADRTELWRIRDDLDGRIVEVEAHEQTPDGSLRHPRFVRFRDTIEKGVKE